eukprot:CAMPEP_0206219568 /NCGR_PEP_ID=MMETSP0047_2-20121206/4384_1 /ASSEMBLY_ACC=CAM_ASM_000192 /TAXON_ID=195065 /ORGANISM="Chroomonas mesostigmatica_cf, Strain CCMP1168" /LENGTH=148 /DNA_ID=CAMNT_0053642111 /DNA_START=112 /DNA_END=558 /DNA_ORIENTATION=-
MSAGFVHSCGVSANGTGYCWGKNDNGQVEVPAVLELPRTQIPDPNNPGSLIVKVEWQYIDASYFHSCGLTINGTVLCWGNDDAGQSSVPDLTMLAGEEVVQVSSGSAYCWGPSPHGPRNYWFLGQVQPPNATFLTPFDTTGDFLSPWP